MRKFLQFAMRGRGTATAVTVLSLLLPPFSFVGGGIIGLATLRHGLAEGAFVAVVSMLLSGVVTAGLLGTLVPVGVFALVTGLPVLALAAVLRASGSQGFTLAVGGLMGAGGVLAMRAVTDDPVAWWRGVLGEVLIAPGEGVRDPAATERLQEMVDLLAPVMTGLPAGMVFGAVLTLLLARWWHAILDNPGGFGQEFRALRIDPRFGAATVALLALTLLANEATGGVAAQLLQVAVVLYLLQGLAVAHGLVQARGAPGGVLLVLYLALFLGTRVVADLLAVVGLLDTWLDFRRRFGGGRRI